MKSKCALDKHKRMAKEEANPCPKPRVRAPESSTPKPKKSSGRVSASKTGLERSYLSKLVAYSPATTQWSKKPVYAVVGCTYIVGRVCDYKYARKGECMKYAGSIPCSRKTPRKSI